MIASRGAKLIPCQREMLLPYRPRRAPHAPPRGMFPFTAPLVAAYVVTPGLQMFSAGNGSILIPNYNSITIVLKGSGGGGGAGLFNSGLTGGVSTVFTGTNLVANGGGGGSPGNHINGPNGPDGTATGPASASTTTGGGQTGGNGGYAFYDNATYTSGRGGNGGLVSMTWNDGDPGAPAVGSTLTFSIGSGGAGGVYGGGNSAAGLVGTNGFFAISWN